MLRAGFIIRDWFGLADCKSNAAKPSYVPPEISSKSRDVSFKIFETSIDSSCEKPPF